ncbi:MAG TPA: M48 family metalloprotease [Longimicrobiaceae bacterium]|nr:M48 family metalloprotease [Longimicrobiaceae bacterium]
MRRYLAAAAVVAALISTLHPAPAGAQDILGRVRRAAQGAAGASFPIGYEKEMEIGRGIAATVVGRWRVVNDAALNDYVNLVGQVVAQQSPRAGEVSFRFAVLDTDDVNALAAPGGFIFVTRGALALMESESELAGVLGHEVGHVDAKHVLNKIRSADQLTAARSEANLTGPLLDQVAALGAGALFNGIGRTEELEADSLGMLYAVAAGYRADGMMTFVNRLAAASNEPAARGRFLSELRATHPGADVRVPAFQRQMAAAQMDPASGAQLPERYRRYVRRQ